MKNKHIVLGAGVIGIEVYNLLKENKEDVSLASSSSRTTENYIQLNALNKEDIINKTKAITHLYITIGLPYNKKVWRKQWPIIIDNCLEAIKRTKL